jgi:hypothetical protein
MLMATSQAMCTSFKGELLVGHHTFGVGVTRGATTADTFKAALYLASATVNASTTAYSATGEVTGTGYTAGGTAVPAASTASSSGSAVTLPASSALSWTNGSGGSWSIQSFDLTDSAAARSWFGDFNGAPVTVANGNTFQIAVGGISIGLA